MDIKQFHLVCTFIIWCLFSFWNECSKNSSTPWLQHGWLICTFFVYGVLYPPNMCRSVLCTPYATMGVVCTLPQSTTVYITINKTTNGVHSTLVYKKSVFCTLFFTAHQWCAVKLVCKCHLKVCYAHLISKSALLSRFSVLWHCPCLIALFIPLLYVHYKNKIVNLANYLVTTIASFLC